MQGPQFGVLLTRPMPKQERAQRRVVQILEGAAAVLREQPHRALSANLVAKRAGVPVSSIYRYFPSMHDLVGELYLQAAADIRAELEVLVARPGPWRQRLAAVMQMLVGYLRDHPYYSPLLVLVASERGPTRVEHDFNAQIVGFLADRWAAGGDGFHGDDAKAVAGTAVQLVLALEELIAQQTTAEAAARHAHEMQRALESYLAAYLRDEPDQGDTP